MIKSCPGRVAVFRRYLQALGLLPDLYGVFLSQFLLSALVVLHLIGQFRLMLCSDQVGSSSLHRAQLPELELLGGLVVPQQHGTLQILLGLLLVQVLEEDETEVRGNQEGQEENTDRCTMMVAHTLDHF